MRNLFALVLLLAVAALFSADSVVSQASAQGYYVRGNPVEGYISPRNRVVTPDGYAVSQHRERHMAPCGRDYYGRLVPCPPPVYHRQGYHGHHHNHGCGSAGGAVAGAVIAGIGGAIIGGALGGDRGALAGGLGGAGLGGVIGGRSGC